MTSFEKVRGLKENEHTSPYINRELSWIEFNQRVLEESRRLRTPLLEKVRFLSICYSNLDEFFMVRVAGKKKALQAGLLDSDSPDKPSLHQALKMIAARAHEFVTDMYASYTDIICKELEASGIFIDSLKNLSEIQRRALAAYFQKSVLPVLTPLSVDPAHPFPFLANRRLYLMITFESEHPDKDSPPLAFVEVPGVLPRLIPIPQDNHNKRFILLEELITHNLEQLFFFLPIKSVTNIRMTRNLDITLLESEVVDLLTSIQSEVKAREQAEVVRLEISQGATEKLKTYLSKKFNLTEDDIYEAPGPLALNDLQILSELQGEGWRHAPFNPRLPNQLKNPNHSIFRIVRDADLMIHHPYESFYTVIELLHAAAWDPDVLAIKQTLYRTSGDSPIIDALIQAAEQGKQVTAVVELKARFDETNNIVWANRMEQAGVHVVYGFIGLKTHCKMTLIVRKEEAGLIRYVHLSTGNYNSTTARSYVDIGYISARPEFAQDVSVLFNLLTGFNILSGDIKQIQRQTTSLRKLFVAPLNLREAFITLIDREIESQQQLGNGLIIAKMNALTDKKIIDKLYEASQSGVTIKLIVRGICCLKPCQKGISENIQVISIVGRFLEHSRIFYFKNGGNEEVYLGSADWMPRNMDRRIEILFPIEQDDAKRRIIDEILPSYWKDTANSWKLTDQGVYVHQASGSNDFDCHQKFIEIARQQGIKSIPYDKAIRHNLRRLGRPVLEKKPKRKK